MKGTVKEYKPFVSKNGEFSEDELINYINAMSTASEIDLLLNPLEKAIEKSRKKEFEFGEFKVKKTHRKQPHTRWELIAQAIDEFLKIRSDDSRAKTMEGLEYFDGIGYCIDADDVLEKMGKEKKEHTTYSEYIVPLWPRMQEGEKYPKRVSIPRVDLSVITPDNLSLGLKLKRLKGGLEKEVIGAYKLANKVWLKNETGYIYLTKRVDGIDEVSLPENTIQMPHRIGRINVLVGLVIERNPPYGEAIKGIEAELKTIKAGSDIVKYKIKREKGVTYVNIKTVYDRLTELLQIQKEARYVIVP